MRAIRRALAALALLLAALQPALAADVISYAPLDSVLALDVRDGRVDYGALARDRGPLTRLLATAYGADPERFSREAQIAFWVNVYNARVLDGVARRPGLRSVLDVGKAVGVPTLGFFHERAVVAGRDLSLDDIEHQILRASFHEPRLHFVLNCASASCPKLPAHALHAASLDSTLDAAAAAFLADPARNRITPGGELQLSSIFKWYRGDFEAAAGSLPAFLARHWKGAPLRGDEPIHFLAYDWSLNGHW